MQNTIAISMISCTKTLTVPEDPDELWFTISGVIWKQLGYKVID